ncbi:MAG: hypothetical protein ACI8QZ_001807 [Chlamydiales bacterium]|jgi:hypothetical protein
MKTTAMGRVGFWMTTVVGSLLLGCSGGSGTGGGTDFQIVEISVQPNQEWQINRPIEVGFSADVDFSTVNLNTIRIGDTAGRSATGLFTLALNADGSTDTKRVRFQPACPTLSDNSDAGLLPGGVIYTLSVAGAGADGLSVRATDGTPLENGRAVTFTTPDSPISQLIFQDPVPGPPAVRLRGAAGIGPDEVNATYLELGGDPDNRVYFELSASQIGELPRDSMGNPFPVSLNHYSVIANQIAVVLHLNQPIEASDANISSARVRLEYEDPRITNPDERWVALATEVELTANCTETGSVVRLEPIGVLPQGANLRVNLTAGFADLAGNDSVSDRTNFAHMVTTLVNNPGTADSTRDADEILESFLVGGALSESIEDLDAPLALPRADWDDGQLTAGFAFTGTGGTNGTFDWIVRPGVQITLDTVLARIEGGNGAITGEQLVLNGMIDVRNVFIPASSQVLFQGPNPVTILASGTVDIQGELVASGGDSLGVGTLGTANVPEPGAAGRAGGGTGGTGSFLTSQSTPGGGPGFGAFGQPGGGGGGGETSYHATIKNARRGAGGGGGRLGPDVYYPLFDDANPAVRRFVQCQTRQGMDAEPGFDGSLPAAGTGAISQTARAMGGVMAPLPFLDNDVENNFFGSLIIDPGGPAERLVRGELDRTWAGGGGGAGGDAVKSDTFPLVPFLPTGDEKGSGGGGGGGSITILAIGDIIVGEGGRIDVDGGKGGAGENSLFFDRVGGGAGGGSGGHIVLSSANQISITSMGEHTGPFYQDPSIDGGSNLEHPARAISAVGGRGGPGREDFPMNKKWNCDAIPEDRLDLDFPNGGEIRVPPLDEGCFGQIPGPPPGSPAGGGGDGGPGLIQLHVDSPEVNLLFPGQQLGGEIYGVDLDVTRATMPPPVGWTDFDSVNNLLPFFGSESIAQSRWIRLGHGRLTPDPANPGGFLADEQVLLRFSGTDAGGSLDRTGTTVDLLAPVIGPDPLGASPTLPYIDPASGGAVMVLDAAGLAGADEVYKRNVALNRELVLQLVDSADADNVLRFSVSSAVYDSLNDQLRVTVLTADGFLTDFVAAGTIQVSYIPMFFRVNTTGIDDQLPDAADIIITFDATDEDAVGKPNPALAYSEQDDGMGGANGFTGEISDLNAQNWDFVRFRVRFDLNTATGGGVDLSTPRPALEHLRIQLDY